MMFCQGRHITSPGLLTAFSLSSTRTTWFSTQTHYDTLGVKRRATQQEIKTAFVTLSKKVHPDRNMKDPKLHAKFVKLNEAYSILSKPSKRREYDLSLEIPKSHTGMPFPNHHPTRTMRQTYEEAARRERYSEYRQRYYGKPYHEREFAERIYWNQNREHVEYSQSTRTHTSSSKNDKYIWIFCVVYMVAMVCVLLFPVRDRNKRKEKPKREPWQPPLPNRMSTIQYVIERDLGLIDEYGRRKGEPLPEHLEPVKDITE